MADARLLVVERRTLTDTEWWPSRRWFAELGVMLVAVAAARAGVHISSDWSIETWLAMCSVVLTLVAVSGVSALYLARAVGDPRLTASGAAIVVGVVSAVGVTRFNADDRVVSWSVPMALAVAVPTITLFAFAPRGTNARSHPRRGSYVVGRQAAITMVLMAIASRLPEGHVHLSMPQRAEYQGSGAMAAIALGIAIIAGHYALTSVRTGSAALGEMALVPVALAAGAVIVADSNDRLLALVVIAFGAVATASSFIGHLLVRENIERQRAEAACASARAEAARANSIQHSTDDLVHEARAGLLGMEAAWRGVLARREEMTDEQVSGVMAGVLSEMHRLRTLVAADRADPADRCPESFSVHDSLAGLAQVAAFGFREFEFDVPESLRASGRPNDVAQIVRVLLSNAERHAGRAALRAAASDDTGDVCVWVADDGPGIAPARADVIFERGYSGDQHGGFGIGLTVARHLAESHGGSLRVVPGVSAGATFELRLPRALDQAS
jgi:signal transduction histidine kinase